MGGARWEAEGGVSIWGRVWSGLELETYREPRGSTGCRALAKSWLQIQDEKPRYQQRQRNTMTRTLWRKGGKNVLDLGLFFWFLTRITSLEFHSKVAGEGCFRRIKCEEKSMRERLVNQEKIELNKVKRGLSSSDLSKTKRCPVFPSSLLCPVPRTLGSLFSGWVSSGDASRVSRVAQRVAKSSRWSMG